MRKKENYIDDSKKKKNVTRDLRQLKPLCFPDICGGRYEKLLYLLAKCVLRFFQKVKLYWKHTTVAYEDSLERNSVDKNCLLKYQEILARLKKRTHIHKIKYMVLLFEWSYPVVYDSIYTY